MPEFTIIVSGKPVGKGRPKFNRATGAAYTPTTTTVAEREIRQAWREADEPRMPDDVALGMEVVVSVERPKGHFKKNGELSAVGLRNPIPRNKKPDLDNVVKLIMDSLNSRAYRDDVLIARLTVDRKWSDWPSTSIRVYTLHE